MGVPRQHPGERDRQAQCLVDGAAAQQPLERDADVAALLGEPVEPVATVRARRLLGGVLAIGEEVVGVLETEGFEILAFGGPLGRELADGVQHPEARFRVPAGIGPQRAKSCRRATPRPLRCSRRAPVEDRRRTVERRAALEQREPAEQRLLGCSRASHDHSSVARSDRWRAGRSRGPPVNSSSRWSSRSSSARGGRSLARSAASSIASGRRSSRAQMASTTCVLLLELPLRSHRSSPGRRTGPPRRARPAGGPGRRARP